MSPCTDDIEFERLDKQHVTHILALGALYQDRESVRRVLAPEDGVEKRILDCGAGGGNWLDTPPFGLFDLMMTNVPFLFLQGDSDGDGAQALPGIWYGVVD